MRIGFSTFPQSRIQTQTGAQLRGLLTKAALEAVRMVEAARTLVASPFATASKLLLASWRFDNHRRLTRKELTEVAKQDFEKRPKHAVLRPYSDWKSKNCATHRGPVLTFCIIWGWLRLLENFALSEWPYPGEDRQSGRHGKWEGSVGFRAADHDIV
jgi:hypothetical protein